MKVQGKEIELLAPAGSYEGLTAVIKAGCDAVYFGIAQLNMRAASISNFGSLEDLPKVAKLCHQSGIKCYLTLNTVLYDHDLPLMRKIVDEVKSALVDGIIVSDMAALMYAREQGVDAHISTQVSISNTESIKFFSQFTDRVVLARELNINMVKNISVEITRQGIRGPKGDLMEIEAFIHGAMCVAVSGRCGMSLFTDNSSANRGACKQNCRRTYTVTDDKGNELVLDNNYIMSPNDLCTIGMLDTIIDAGISVLKIEGRGRAPEYADTVIRCYREALEAIDQGTYTQGKVDEWNKRLGTVYNRGFGTGFYMGRQMEEWSGAYGSKATEEKFYLGEVRHYYPKAQVAEIEIMANSLTQKETYLIIGPTTGVLRGTADTILVEEEEAPSAEQNTIITLKVSERVRVNDKVYVVRNTVRSKDR